MATSRQARVIIFAAVTAAILFFYFSSGSKSADLSAGKTQEKGYAIKNDHAPNVEKQQPLKDSNKKPVPKEQVKVKFTSTVFFFGDSTNFCLIL